MEQIVQKLANDGPIGAVLAIILLVVIFVIIRGRITFEYPRPRKK